jgi:hypothetical protein
LDIWLKLVQEDLLLERFYNNTYSSEIILLQFWDYINLLWKKRAMDSGAKNGVDILVYRLSLTFP